MTADPYRCADTKDWPMSDFDLPAPYARITRAGRWTYSVRIVDGLMWFGTGCVFGAARAERKAKRELRRYLRREAWRQQVTRVEAGP